jgi:hypothetical protein
MAPRQAFLHLTNGSADQVFRIARLAPDLHCAGFEAGHVQEVAHKSVEALGFLMRRLDQAAAGSRIQVCILLGQRAQSAGYGDQRRAQSCEIEFSSAVCLSAALQIGLRTVPQDRPFNGQRGLVGKGFRRRRCSGQGMPESAR